MLLLLYLLLYLFLCMCSLLLLVIFLNLLFPYTSVSSEMFFVSWRVLFQGHHRFYHRIYMTGIDWMVFKESCAADIVALCPL